MTFSRNAFCWYYSDYGMARSVVCISLVLRRMALFLLSVTLQLFTFITYKPSEPSLSIALGLVSSY